MMPTSHSPTRTMRFVNQFARLLILARKPLGILFMAITVILGISALNTHFDTGFDKLVPQDHEFMKAFNDYSDQFTGANRILISLNWKGEGDIYNAAFMEKLKEAHDEIYFTPGVNRTTVRSLFSPAVRYSEITEFGFMGGEVIPSRFSALEEGLALVRSNVSKSGQIGNLVSNDQSAAMVQAELLEFDSETGKKTDYAAVAKHLESIRDKLQDSQINVQIIGFSKVMGDVMAGLTTVMLFFAIAFLITAILLWGYSKSLKLTILALTVALLPVIWLLGILPLIGYGIDPMSVLVPFLIFSIGVSHAVQMTNAWKQEVLDGATAAAAAETAFQKLAIPGVVALLANALGFMVIMLIDIPMVHELGATACLGVALMIVTNKMFMPIILSHMKLENIALSSARGNNDKPHRLWWAVSNLARPVPALVSFVIVLGLLAAGTYQSRLLLTGDIGSGVPELRESSRYNLDNAQIINEYSIGMDVLSVYVETKNVEEACLNWEVMNAVDRFDFRMRGVDGVESVSTVAKTARLHVSGNNEGNPLWQTLQRSEMALRAGSDAANPENGLNNANCETINMMVYLKNHENATLKHVVGEIEHFIENSSTENITFRLAGGNAGVAAATNDAVEHAEAQILISIFISISLLCWLTFRSWRGVLCVVVPLILVCILCNALMSLLGIGLKVATLPVIALGVGVGVDYGIYIYERMQHEMHSGVSLRTGFYRAMEQRGTAAVFTSITMTLGVGTWAFSALKFQADMGILLAFMFLVNVLGAIFLLPALACWLNVEGKERAKASPPSSKGNHAPAKKSDQDTLLAASDTR